MTVWLNGEPFDSARVPFDVADRGLLLGDGVFDTALALGGRVAFRAEHLARLMAACETLGFTPDAALVAGSMDAAARDVGTGSVRVTVTRGPGPRGIAPPAEARPSVIATNATGAPALAFRAVRLWPTAIRRNETSPASRLKTLGYLDAVLALAEARTHGCDEALFLNGAGAVASAGAGNLFALRGDTLATPPPADGVLSGIARGAVLRLAAAAGLRATEARLMPEDLTGADAVFMTNSLRLVAPVAAIGDAAPAPCVSAPLRRLAEALVREIGRECGVDASAALRPDRLDAPD